LNTGFYRSPRSLQAPLPDGRPFLLTMKKIGRRSQGLMTFGKQMEVIRECIRQQKEGGHVKVDPSTFTIVADLRWEEREKRETARQKMIRREKRRRRARRDRWVRKIGDERWTRRRSQQR
jgi:DNA modification methylase